MFEFSFFPDVVSTICIIFWLSFFWKSYLEFRQYRLIHSFHNVPEPISKEFPSKQLQDAKSYQIDLMKFSFFFDLYSQIELTCILYFGLLLKSWIFVSDIFSCIGFDSTYDILYSELWLFLLNMIFTSFHQPWELYRIFVLEQTHGFNKMTLSMYCLDFLMSFMINQVIIIPSVAIFIYIVRWGGSYFYIYSWLFLSFIIVLLMTIYPTWIAPMFDTYTPLKPGELRKMIEVLSKRISFPLKRVFIVDSSRKSAHSNAYFYGFWENKRIVLFDTLLSADKESQAILSNPRFDPDRCSKVFTELGSDNRIVGSRIDNNVELPKYFEINNTNGETENSHSENASNSFSNQEILAIVCHELGHWYHSHNLKSLLINEIVLFIYIVLFSFTLSSDIFYVKFGFLINKPIIVGIVIIFGFIFAPIDLFLSFCINILIRHYEYSADAFAAEMGLKSLLISSLIKITRDNKSYPIYDPLYSIFYKHHPSVLERISALENYKSD